MNVLQVFHWQMLACKKNIDHIIQLGPANQSISPADTIRFRVALKFYIGLRVHRMYSKFQPFFFLRICSYR
jgi:hypothetical protein